MFIVAQSTGSSRLQVFPCVTTISPTRLQALRRQGQGLSGSPGHSRCSDIEMKVK